jgi:uncharacterized delta-60 repeat protein
VAPLADGSVYIGGRFSASHGLSRKNIAKLLPDGKPDTVFNPGAGFNAEVFSLATRADGSVVAGGKFTTYNGAAAKGLAVVASTGRIAFNAAQPDTADVRWVQVHGGKIYVAGKFFKIGGKDMDCLARLTSNGAVDMTFLNANGANDAVNDAAIQSDGSLYVAGNFTQWAGQNRNRIAKLTKDGVLDIWGNALSFDGEIKSVKVCGDKKVLVTGDFRYVNGMRCRGAARLKTDGSIDPDFKESDLDVQGINTSN